jgi:hypothetical protein
MSNVIIAYNNLIDLATLTGGTFETNLPRDNLKTDKLAEVAQTTTDAAFTLTATFAANQNVGCIALANHNFSSAATIAIAIKNSGGDILESPTGDLAPYIDADRNSLLYWFADANHATARSVDITITDTSNPDTYLSAGRLFIGKWFETSVNVEYGDVGHGRIDLSETSKSVNGVKWHRQRKKIRTAAVGLKHLTVTEMLSVDDLMQHDGTTQDVIYALTRPTYTDNAGVLSQDELSYKRTFIGNLTSLDALNSPFFERYSAQFNIEELAI